MKHGHIETEEREAPVWDPVAQIYVGGIIPENAEVTKMIQDNKGALLLFGYGSLCWNPGKGPLADPSVVSTLGRARGYRRCWAQRSTDHRGSPSFPGIVCTLLKDEEFRQIREPSYTQSPQEETLTEGLIYTVPPDLVDECLEVLDFREKGVRECAMVHHGREMVDVSS
jgi:cation transport regulator ChaC